MLALPMKFSVNREMVLSTTGFVMLLVCLSTFSTPTAELRGYLAGSMPQSASASLPVGTIIPVKLDKTLSRNELQAGLTIAAQVTQDVPLPDREKIRSKSRASGTIVSVTQAGGDAGVQVSLRFNQIEDHGEIIPITASLRALASFDAVQSALTPVNNSTGAFSSWANTVLIGGDVRYGDGGEVLDRQKRKVGKGVTGGVLLHVQSGNGCEGPVNGDDRLQALWVFSSDACGVYGIPGVQITHDGNTSPIGIITLSFEKSGTKIDGSAGMLLRIVSP